MQKGEQKIKANPNRSAQAALPTHRQHSTSFFTILLLATKQQTFFSTQLFQNLIVV